MNEEKQTIPNSGLVDSGVRAFHESGAMREPDINKPRPALISPFALTRIAQHYANGAKKYSERNWEKGMNFSRYTDSLMRHAIAWMSNDCSEDHLAAIAWNAMAIMHHQERQENHLDDMPKY